MAYSPLELAEAFIQAGEIDDALDALNTHLLEHPDDDSARHLRATVLIRLPTEENLQQALDDFTVLAQTNLPAEYALLCAVIHERLGDIPAAITTLEDALTHEKNAPRLVERLCDLYCKQSDYKKALALIQQQPDSHLWQERAGDIHALMHEFDAVTIAYDCALVLMKDTLDLEHNQHHRARYARVLMAQGAAFHKMNALERAKKAYSDAVHYTDDPVLDFNSGLLAALEGDIDTAVKLCRRGFDAASERVQEEMRLDLNLDVYAALRAKLSDLL